VDRCSSGSFMTSAGGLLVPTGITRPVISVYTVHERCDYRED